MTTTLRIQGGEVYDPANGVDGVVRDILIVDGKVAATLPPGVPPSSVRSINANGMVVMPGGVDIHCHIASSGVNRARMIRGEEHATHVHAPANGPFRSGSGVLTPSTFTTGYRYAALGYTSALEAAVAPSDARHTHLELDDTPNLDAGFLLLLANHHGVLELLDRGDADGAIAFVSHLLRVTGACGIKVVNPGGVAAWREDATHHTVSSIDEPLFGKPTATRDAITPRRILELMCTAAERLGLSHPPHIHCNRLGLPGNVSTTLDTLRAMDGRRAHLTHLQFHAYGATAKGDFTSGAAEVMAYLNDHPGITADVGQVMFGDAVTLTGDTPLEYLLWKLTGAATKPYISIESELEGGCGLMPIHYSDKQFLHSLQWAIGLELMLTASDPWRMQLSTDHPNGGSFLSYPAIIAALMSKALRDELIAKAHPRAMRRCGLAGLTREMTLSEIAIVTRAGPARALGWKHKGQLGVGADGDVTIYEKNLSDPKRMFESPRWVVKGGRVLVEDGELRDAMAGKRMAAAVAPDERGRQLVGDWFARMGSYDVAQLGLREHQIAGLRQT